MFRDWASWLPGDVDLCAVEPPGRGTRVGEPLIDDPGHYVRELADALAPLSDLPVVLFGHSLGARMAFRLAHQGLRADALIASGSRAPHVAPRRRMADLSRDAFVRELAELGGTPREILEDVDFVDSMLPMLRADFRLAETSLVPPSAKVACPITALTGDVDAGVTTVDAGAWQAHTTSSFRLVSVAGGHFFLTSNPGPVRTEVRRVIADTSSG